MGGDRTRPGPDGIGGEGADEEYLSSPTRRRSWRAVTVIAIGTGLVAGLIAWRLASQGGTHGPANSARSSVIGPAESSVPHSPVAGLSAVPACPRGHACRTVTVLPPSALRAIHAHLPAAHVVEDQNVVDSTDGALMYRRIVVTSDGFELIIWASVVADSLPSDASFTTASGYHVKFLCSGPARQCPARAQLLPIATDERLFSVR